MADVLPTLIGLMTAVGVLRASGILEVLSELLKFPAALCHIPVPVIPIILVRIISSSAAVGLILDIFKEYGPDSLVGNMVSIMIYCKTARMPGKKPGVLSGGTAAEQQRGHSRRRGCKS